MAATALTLQQQGRFGELVNSEYSPFNISPVTGNAQENAGVGQVEGAQDIQNRFDAARMNNSNTISNSGIGDGHNQLREQARGVIESAQVQNAGVVTGHNEASNAYLDDKDNPAVADLGNISSVQPITDHNRNSANAVRESWGQAKETINNLTDAIRGVEDSPPPPLPTDPQTGETWTSDVPPPWDVPGPASTSQETPKPVMPSVSISGSDNSNGYSASSSELTVKSDEATPGNRMLGSEGGHSTDRSNKSTGASQSDSSEDRSGATNDAVINCRSFDLI